MWWLSPTPAGADNHEAALGLGLLSGEHSTVTVLADSAHGTGEFPKLAERGHIDRVKPAQSPRPIPGGFIVDDFTVDHADAKRLKDLAGELHVEAGAGRRGLGEGRADGDRQGKLLSPERQRAAVHHLITTTGVANGSRAW
jgi:hypothetical protein